MRISDWSSDVCSSDLAMAIGAGQKTLRRTIDETRIALGKAVRTQPHAFERAGAEILDHHVGAVDQPPRRDQAIGALQDEADAALVAVEHREITRSEEHTSELQSLMRISYAVFCLKKKIKKTH